MVMFNSSSAMSATLPVHQAGNTLKKIPAPHRSNKGATQTRPWCPTSSCLIQAPPSWGKGCSPSDKLTKLWKDPPFLMGKSTISTGPCSIAMLNYQRVSMVIISHDRSGWCWYIYIYANITGGFCWWDPWSTIYSSTMDPMGMYIYISHMQPMALEYESQHLPHKSPSFVGKYTIHGAYGYIYITWEQFCWFLNLQKTWAANVYQHFTKHGDWNQLK